MRLKMISHRDALAFVKERFGAAALERALGVLDPQDRDIALSQSKLINSWVDVDAHVRLLTAIVREVAGGDVQVLRAMGEWIATEQLTRIYQVFLMVVSPEFMLKRSSLIFHTFYDGGTMEVTTLAPGRIQCTFRGFTTAQCLIEHSITGWFAGAAKLSRAKDSQVTITTSLASGRGHFQVLFCYDNPQA